MIIPFYSRNDTRKYIVAFMDFFQNITVERMTTEVGSAGQNQVHYKYMRVPVMWATTEKWIQVLNSTTARKGFEPDRLANIPVELEWALPRLAVSMVGLTYDPARHVGKSMVINDFTNNPASSEKNIWAPVPYNLDLEVTAVAKNVNDLFQIMEQIIPFFSPSLSLNVKLIEGKPSESVSLVLNSVSPELEEEITETDERVFKMTFSFYLKANYYLPQRLDRKIVKEIDINIMTYDDVIATRFASYISNSDPTIKPDVIDLTGITVTEKAYD